MKVKRFLPLILLAIAVFAGVSGYGDFDQVADHLLSFPPSSLLLALALAMANYLLRYLRWEYYLRLLHTTIPTTVSALVFCSGLAMALTPGKVGEVSKSFLLRDLAQVPVTVSAPVVVMERITDLLAIAVLSLGALFFLPFGAAFAFAGVAVLMGLLLVLVLRPGGKRVLRLPLIRRWGQFLESSSRSLATLSLPKPLLIAMALSMLAWLSEGVALWVVARGLDLSLPVAEAVPVYAASTLIGAASLLPGGLGGTEGSMVVLLGRLDLPRDGASAATLLVRLCTLWFAFLLGVVSLLWLQRLPRPGNDT